MTRMPYKAAVIACKKALWHHCTAKLLRCQRMQVRTENFSSGGGGRVVNVTFEIKPRSFSLEELQQLTSEFDAIIKTQLLQHHCGYHGISTRIHFRNCETGDLIRPSQVESVPHAEPRVHPKAEQLDSDMKAGKLKLVEEQVLITVGVHEETDQVLLVMEEPINSIKILEPETAERIAHELILFAQMAKLQKQARPRSST